MSFPAASSSKRTPALSPARGKTLLRQSAPLARRLFLESLEKRDLMALMPYGAMPDDLGEYMLGDIVVSVVLMESNNGLVPQDTNQEDWTQSSIDAVKAKVEEGVTWWKETLHKAFPDVSQQLLNFEFDYDFANAPVQTGYEPINRPSTDYTKWIKDFISQSGISSTNNISTDIRLFNEHQRQDHHASWAFTIFVVNDEHDADGMFPQGGVGSYRQGFAFAADKFMVVPANRPASTYAHETGHMFWAWDEYTPGGDPAASKRGYYDTPNGNSATGNTQGFVQTPTIMTDGALRDEAYANHVSDPYTLATIGWQDSDNDNIFDVLDVPFRLEGTGWYDTDDSTYKFFGSTAVRTLFNRNSDGLGNDITINLIRDVQYSVDGSAWSSVGGTWNDYMYDLQLSIPVNPGSHLFKLRTIDTITGAMSPEYIVENSQIPGIMGDSGVQGYVWMDTDADGIFDPDEVGVDDLAVQLVLPGTQQPLVLKKSLIPDDFASGDPVYRPADGVLLSVDANGLVPPTFTGEVIAYNSTTAPFAGNVFAGAREAGAIDTWNMDGRALRGFRQSDVDGQFDILGSAGNSRGRLEAYDAAGNLLDRVVTNILHGSSNPVVLTVSSSAGNIAMIKAGGDLGSYIVLEDLEWGPSTMATTNSVGAFWLPNLAPGSYDVRVNTGNFRITSTPISGHEVVDVTSAGPQTLNFGLVQLANPWHNSVRNYDVNDSGGVDISDLLIQIHYYNLYANQQLPVGGPGSKSFVDIDNDGALKIEDILRVVFEYNRTHGSGEHASSVTHGASSGGSSGPSGAIDKVAPSPGGSSTPAGETAATPATAGSEGGSAAITSADSGPSTTAVDPLVSTSDDDSAGESSNNDDGLARWSQQVRSAFSHWDRNDELAAGGDDSAKEDGDQSDDSRPDEPLLDILAEPAV